MGTRHRRRQLAFHFSTWGGERKGAGRKPAAANVGLQAHDARDPFDARNPVHVTMRVAHGCGVPRLRRPLVVRVVTEQIGAASTKGLRVLHFSVQVDHLHLIVEAEDGVALSRGMQRLASGIAMRVNALVQRRGRVWRERYHRRDLESPRQFRNALVYVTFNTRKHAPPSERSRRAGELDLLSSAPWFDDWTDAELVGRLRAIRAGPCPVVAPKTWFARTGWKLYGKLDPRESPRSPS